MSNEQDILNELGNTDLTTVQTTMPVLPAGVYEATIATAKIEQNKAQTGSNLNLKLSLSNPATDENGKQVNPGFPIFDTISLVRTFRDDGTVKYDPLPRVAALAKSMGVSTIMPIETIVGRKVTFRLKIEDDAQFGRKNRMDRYIAQA